MTDLARIIDMMIVARAACHGSSSRAIAKRRKFNKKKMGESSWPVENTRRRMMVARIRVEGIKEPPERFL